MEPKTHGRGALLGVALAIYGAVTQPAVVAQIAQHSPTTAGILSAISFFSPLVNAGLGSVGAVVAAGSMPPGYPKQ